MSTLQLEKDIILTEDATLVLTNEIEGKIPNHLKNTYFQRAFVYSLQNQKRAQLWLKRTIDLLSSAFGILVLLIPFAMIAVIIKLDSRGPVFFRQKRLGLYGQEFYMYKFRSMCEDAENRLASLLEHNEIQSGMFKMENDPRITKIGRFLRKYSLDELPQLLNVLRGEMSLVGPRPPLARELKDYREWHYIKFSVPPGMTGEWQVSGRSSIKHLDDIIYLDFKYIQLWSLKKDFVILLKTIPTVILGKNAA